jgi:hypothetical protein
MSDRWDEGARRVLDGIDAISSRLGVRFDRDVQRTNVIAAALRGAYAEALRDFRDRISDGSASYGGDHLREALAVEIARIAPAQPTTPRERVNTVELLRGDLWRFQPGDVVTHRNGGSYMIAAHALVESSCEPVYVYQSETDGCSWTRPKREMEDGRFAEDPVTYRAGTVPPRIEVGMVLRTPMTQRERIVLLIDGDLVDVAESSNGRRVTMNLMAIGSWPLARDWTEPGECGACDGAGSIRKFSGRAKCDACNGSGRGGHG